MRAYLIRLINSEFDTSETSRFASFEDARKSAVDTAVKMLADAIGEGETSSAIEVEISEGERLVSRQVVSLSVVQLMAQE
jgi:hypothetical protein